MTAERYHTYRVIAVVLIGGAVGCAHDGSLSLIDEMAASGPGFSSTEIAALSTEAATGMMVGEDVWSGSYRVVQDEDDVPHETATVSIESVENERWLVEQLGDELVSMRRLIERDIDEGGGLVIDAMRNVSEGVFTRFVPGIAFLPEELRRGDTFEETLEVLVSPLDEPERVRQRGRAVHRMALIGEAALPEASAGSASTAVLVRAELEINFGLAKVTRVTERWFADGELVARRVDERVNAPFVSRQRRWAMVAE